jgi:hypothetical protein
VNTLAATRLANNPVRDIVQHYLDARQRRIKDRYPLRSSRDALAFRASLVHFLSPLYVTATAAINVN